MKWIALLLLLPMASAQMPNWAMEGIIEESPVEPVLPGDAFDVVVAIELTCPMPASNLQQAPTVTVNITPPPGWPSVDDFQWQPEGDCQAPIRSEFPVTFTMPDDAIALDPQMFVVHLTADGDGQTQARADNFTTSFVTQAAFTGDVIITADRYQSASEYPVITYHVVNNANGPVAIRPVGGTASFDFAGNGMLIDPFTTKDYPVPWRDQDFQSGPVRIDWQAWYAFDDTQLAGPVQTTEVILTRTDAPAVEVPGIGIVPLAAALLLRRR